MKRGRKQLVLNKGSQKYIFRYDEGSEGQLLDCLAAKAAEKNTDFDWFDAAVLSFKLTQSLMGQADDILHNGVADAMDALGEEYM